jgi:hypothetical protein
MVSLQGNVEGSKVQDIILHKSFNTRKNIYSIFYFHFQFYWITLI